MKCTVSVIIRTKNRPDMLREAIASVANQTYQDIELVVVNDGGTDVESLVRAHATGSIRQVVYTSLKPGRGRAAAANVGLARAGGDYLIFLDDDDWFAPEHIANLLEPLQADDDLVASHGNTACVTLEAGRWRTVFEFNQALDVARLAYENHLPLHAVLFRKSALGADCRFPEGFSLYEDWGFWLLLSQKGRFVHVDKTGAYYRLASDSGVGVPGTALDVDQEYARFIQWAKAHWSDEQALALARNSLGLRQLQAQYEQERQERQKTLTELHRYKAALADVETKLKRILASRSWRYTRFLRHAARLARVLSNKARIRSGLMHLVRGEFSSILHKLRAHYANESLLAYQAIQPGGDIVILCTPHTLFIALLLEHELERLAFSVSLLTQEPAAYDDRLHIVICPQMFKRLPGLYIAFQMEQSVSSRWFNSDYLKRLEHALAIVDYSLENIAYLQRRGLSYRQIYYLPLGCHPDLLGALARKGWRLEVPAEKKYDVVFYGDINNARRRKILDALSARFRIKILSEVFGEKLYNEILSAKVVLNVHYYEGALLETTRIYECLSLGVPVVSETSSDQAEHAALEGVVKFAPCGDIAALADALAWVLEHHEAQVHALRAAQRKLESPFGFFFRRLLLAHDMIDFQAFYAHDEGYFRIGDRPLCLGLPETVDRQARFAQKNRHGFQVFPGLRHRQGWIGCAMSYKYLLSKAQEEKRPYVLICEDDVEFPEDFSEKLAIIMDYLQRFAGQWSVFSGLIANAHADTEVSAVRDFRGVEFLHINKLVSTVFNIYDASIYATIAAWDPANRDVDSNTIDRYIEHAPGLTVVTTLPFLVGHEEESHSTLWGFQNVCYLDLIRDSAALLRAKAERFKNGVAAEQEAIC